MATWQIEFANGDRSRVYDTLELAKAALPDWWSHQARMSPRFSEPVAFVSSDRQRVEISAEA